MIVMPSADLDLAASDLVKSAFGHAGQKCSAASLAILVGPVGRSKRFARQLVDATTSLRVGPPDRSRCAEVRPVIEPPQGKLDWALTTLDEGEAVARRAEPLVSVPSTQGGSGAPASAPACSRGRASTSRSSSARCSASCTPTRSATRSSCRTPSPTASRRGCTRRTPTTSRCGSTACEAGNLYVNRGITGAIVQRQPFGGWKRSSVGAGTKAGGPNYLIGLGSWRASGGGPASTTLHLRGLDSRITSVIEAAQPSLDYEAFEWLRRAALSDAIAWDREFGQVKDVSRLGVERNLFRYRPVPRRGAGDGGCLVAGAAARRRRRDPRRARASC